MINGVDISAYQGAIDYDVLQTKARFLYVRAASGKTEDAYLKRNAGGASRAGLPWGPYYVPQPSSGRTWEVQANFHAGLYKAYPGVLLPALDIERTGGLAPVELESWLVRYLNQFLNASGAGKVMIYTSSGFFNYQLLPGDIFWRYPLWLADYTPPPNVPIEWERHNKTYTLWQTGIYKPATDFGCPAPPEAAAGIDLDRFEGDEQDFFDFFGVMPGDVIVMPPALGARVRVTATINPRTQPVLDPATDAGTIRPGYIFEKAGEPENGFQPVKVWLAEKYLEQLP